jgi:proline iminopeptidase
MSFTLDMLVDDLEELRVHVALDQLYLVGHSLGALIAAEYAYQYPQRVERLCMIAAPASQQPRNPPGGI